MIIEVWGVGAGLTVVSATYVASVVFVTGIGNLNQSESVDTDSVFGNFVSGLVYIKNNSIILTVIMITCAFGGFGKSHMQVVPAMLKTLLGNLGQLISACFFLPRGGFSYR
ncbi:MAG: hypothetical protein Ct9H300mP11_05850 [Chloroflexota bacterium]|nr:MAG: hypothetical protein Ct9H300mP11_05850 [Chloroflexota bacterium]